MTTKKELKELVAKAEAALQEAEDFARKHNLSFRWDGPAYGMGGYFDPEVTVDQYGDESNGWQASANSC